MAKISLNDIVNTYNTTLINDNFDDIASEFQNKVLYRNNPVGEPNQMLINLDMNSRRILNLPAPVSPSEPVRLQDITETLSTSIFLGIGDGITDVTDSLQQELDTTAGSPGTFKTFGTIAP